MVASVKGIVSAELPVAAGDSVTVRIRLRRGNNVCKEDNSVKCTLVSLHNSVMCMQVSE